MAATMNGSGSLTATGPYLWTAGIPRPDHGDGMYQLVCDACGAGWVGVDEEPCYWCERSLALLQEGQRAMLLDPPWLQSDAGSMRYDELSEIDKAVWDRTRGQIRGTDSVVAWVARLRRGVDADLITQNEAEAAMRKVTG
jgi:hypothetical protein